MQNIFVKFVDLAMVLAVVYHGGYGLYSVGKDYIASRRLQILTAGLVAVLMVWAAWMGLRLLVISY